MDSPVAAALKKSKPEEEDADKSDDLQEEEEPSLADILSSITELLDRLVEQKKKGPLSMDGSLYKET